MKLLRFDRVGPRLGALALGLCAAGCANTYDKLTSRRFREEPFKTLFTSPDPVPTLRASATTEGDQRIAAMRALKEPRLNGGSEAEQDEMLRVLTDTATGDPSPLCRVAAIDALGRFTDPRASQAIVAAYRNAGQITPSDLPAPLPGKGPVASFPPEQVAAIQCRSLECLGKTGDKQALELLCEVASAPVKVPEKRDQFDALAASGVEQHMVDVKMAALRALGHHSDPQAARALVDVLKADRDPALRGCAREGLVQMTDYDLPADAAAWEAALRPGAEPPPSSPIERVGAWLKQ